MPIIDILDADHFREIVNRESVTVIIFSAVWCGPCRQISNDLDRLTYEFPRATFAKVDADNNPDILQRCKVSVLPTFLLVQGGRELGHIIGADVLALKTNLRTFCSE